MTDKQIIIDGIDVRKCVNRRWDNSQKIHLCYDSDTPLTSWGWCENHPNYYYKQLEKLKAENLGFKILHESDKDLLKRKEQECEELKMKNRILETECNEMRDVCNEFEQYYELLIEGHNKLKQTLAEIKEIVEQGVKIHDDIIVSKQILQKISECGGNDENN